MTNKSKIIMIGPNMNSQGGIASVTKLYKDYHLYKDEIIYLSTYENNNIFLRLIIYCFFLIRYIFILFTNTNIRLVHIHTASKGSFCRKSIAVTIAKVFCKTIILHVHGGKFPIFYNESPRFIKKIITNILDKSDLIIVLSEQWVNKIANITKNTNIKVLYNPTIIKKQKHNDNMNFRVLFLGKLCENKGTYDIIDAAKRIKRNDVVINLYGDGNLQEFEKLIIESNVQDKVKIRGWISGHKKDEVYQNSDILLLPSYNEGLPMSILEAMAYGLPVISTPVGGIPEAVKEDVNGFLIQPGDYKALAEKIDLLANDKALREQMGQKGYEMAKEKFDINIIIKQLREIYDELLK